MDVEANQGGREGERVIGGFVIDFQFKSRSIGAMIRHKT